MSDHYMNSFLSDVFFSALFVLALAAYVTAAILSSRKYKQWPRARYVYLFFGVLSAAVVMVGPLANRAHDDFVAHMVGHLLLGMLAPLLIALAAPMKLMLRTLPVHTARRFTRLLKSWPFRLASDPIGASLLNIGGLWLLYTTDLYMMMQQSFIVHLLVHIHVFLAGYLFTISMIYIDLSPHRTSYIYRTIVFIIALAGHGILSKYIYAHPPAGVPREQAEIGGKIMYYGGDLIDIVLIFILCLHWFRATRPQTSTKVHQFQ
ncbi:cytochrome c oxidase assembly protein [Bacillus tianshenii]|nr:cytochrome c oxidase assembly protein [Bacillus tianshenii]